MKKLALNFICKNEAHIVERMLLSTSTIVDLIVAVDTGSSDDTIEIIRQFGVKACIPTFIFQRPFDNFCNSRNYALQKLIDAVSQVNFDINEVWAFTVDCDETVNVKVDFSKEALSADLYIVKMIAGFEYFNRQVIFKINVGICWEGPIHERLICPSKEINMEFLDAIDITVDPSGASWKGDLVAKFLNYAHKLEEYVQEGHECFRWVFYIGESYCAAATYSKIEAQRMELNTLAKKYYEKALALPPDNSEALFSLYCRLGEKKDDIKALWPDVKQEYLQAFNIHMGKAESLAKIIEHYMKAKQWQHAYVYSSFAYNYFSARSKTDPCSFYTDETIYNWKLLYYNYLAAYNLDKKAEYKHLYRKIQDLIRVSPNKIGQEEILMLQVSSPLILRLTNWRKKLIGLIRSRKEKQNINELEVQLQ